MNVTGRNGRYRVIIVWQRYWGVARVMNVIGDNCVAEVIKTDK